MNKVIFRVLIVFATLMLVPFISTTNAYAANDASFFSSCELLGATTLSTEGSAIHRGTWGSCVWEIDDGGMLTIYPGQGDNGPYYWNAYSDDIVSV